MPPNNPPVEKIQTADPPVLSSLTNTQKSQPFWLTWAAVIVTVGGLGWNAYQKQDPETAEYVTQNHTEEITQIIAVVTMLAGSVLHIRNQSKTEGDLKAAEKHIENVEKDVSAASLAPPAKSDGTFCPYHTTSVAVQQFISRNGEGDLEAAAEIIAALKKLGVNNG